MRYTYQTETIVAEMKRRKRLATARKLRAIRYLRATALTGSLVLVALLLNW